jgi:maltose phosphorylase
MDLDNYNRNTDQGLHVTSAAGVWASMVFGYGGLRTDADILLLQPTLPTQWRSFRFRIWYRGGLLEVSVNAEKVDLQVVDGDAVTVRVYGVDVVVDGRGISVKRTQPGELARSRPDKAASETKK